MPVAEIALPRAATRCFPDLVSKDSNGLVLISFRLARAYARPAGRDGVQSIGGTLVSAPDVKNLWPITPTPALPLEGEGAREKSPPP